MSCLTPAGGCTRIPSTRAAPHGRRLAVRGPLSRGRTGPFRNAAVAPPLGFCSAYFCGFAGDPHAPLQRGGGGAYARGGRRLAVRPLSGSYFSSVAWQTRGPRAPPQRPPPPLRDGFGSGSVPQARGPRAGGRQKVPTVAGRGGAQLAAPAGSAGAQPAPRLGPTRRHPVHRRRSVAPLPASTAVLAKSFHTRYSVRPTDNGTPVVGDPRHADSRNRSTPPRRSVQKFRGGACRGDLLVTPC